MKTGDAIPQTLRDHFPVINSPCLIQFWARSCPSCHSNMYKFNTIKEHYSSLGLSCYYIHRPLWEIDLDQERVLNTASELKIHDNLIFDNDYSIGDSFGVDALPTYFLFDSEGKLRRTAKGEYGINIIEQAIIRILAPTERE